MKTSAWAIVTFSEVSHSSFLVEMLANKFPDLSFRFTSFEEARSAAANSMLEGVILELKHLNEQDFPQLVKLLQTPAGITFISILSPESFMFLNKENPELLKRTAVVMSKLASLNYMSELPRVIQNAMELRFLATQNQVLRRKIQEFDRRSEELA